MCYGGMARFAIASILILTAQAAQIRGGAGPAAVDGQERFFVNENFLMLAARRFAHAFARTHNDSPNSAVDAAAAATVRVVNGEESALGRYPFLATQGDQENDWFFCGASLIRDDWVLTAGHCLYNNPDWQLAVRLQFGRYDLELSNDEEGGIMRRVVEFVKYPEYNAWKYDVALLKLSSPIPASVATPIALDAGGEARAGRDAILAGWGSTDEACSVYDAVQREANLTIASFDECSGINNEMSRWYPRNNGTTLCAGRYVGDDDTGAAASGAEWAEAGCGDSGGPLVVYNAATGVPTQVGIVSWGYGHTHTVYARVSAFKVQSCSRPRRLRVSSP